MSHGRNERPGQLSDHDSETYSRPPARARRGRTRKATPQGSTWVVWALGALAGVLLLAVGVDVAASLGRIHPGVSVAGVRVGGMSANQAVATLELKLPEKSNAPVVVRYQGKAWAVSPEDLDLTFEYEALAASAMAVGRTGGPLLRVKERAGAWLGSAALPARATAEQTKLHAFLNEVSADVDVLPRDAAVKFTGTTPAVRSAETGMMLDREALTTGLLTAFTSSTREVEAPVGVVQADVSDAAAQVAMTAAEAMVAQPATVTFGKKNWNLTSKNLAKMLAFRKTQVTPGAEWSLDPYVSAKEASNTVAPKLGNKIGRPARDAVFRTNSGRVSIDPSKSGIGPDFEALAEALTAALKGPEGQPRVVELRTHKTEPKLTTAAARAMNIKQRISTFTTTYSAGNRPRVNNIHLLGDALDGKLIGPGETFSFNGAIGQRTAAKGYQEANAIVDGKLVPQLGGGICQVGTTLFNTVFLSGLPVLERHNHSFYISHYPKGRDATVSWGGPDLKFKNDTDNWMLIAVSYTSGSITISLYGTDPDYEVTSKTSPFTNIRPFPTEKTKDPTLVEGKTVVEDPGITGRRCTVTRTVSKDGDVIRVDTFKSVYRPKVEIVRVGTKPKPSKPTTGGAGSD